MQLREKLDRNPLNIPARANEAAAGNKYQQGSANAFGSFVASVQISDCTSRMNSHVEKTKLDAICPHCSKRIKWAWVIQYHSYQYTQLVYVCSECEQVIRMQNAPKAPKDSPSLQLPNLQRKK
jgi:DNA-directed RNA polymerase subunit RPC12/RpoP